MTENDENELEGEGKGIVFSYRLLKEDKADLEKTAKILTRGNKTELLIQGVRKYLKRPELWEIGDAPIITDTATKEDLHLLGDRLFQQQQETLQKLHQMSQLLIHQQENGEKADLLEEIKQKLLNYDKLVELDTYKKIEDFLVQEYPSREEEITDEKVYNEILLELMQEGFLAYKVRSRRLKWSNDKENES